MEEVKEIFNLIQQIDVVYDNIDNKDEHRVYFKLDENIYFRAESRGKERPFDFNIDGCIRKLITKYYSDKGIDKPANHYNDIFIPLKRLIINKYF